MCCCIEFDKTCTRIHHCQDWYQNSQNIIHHVTNYFPARLFTLSWNFLRYSWKLFLCQALLYLPLKLTPLTQIFLLKRKKNKRSLYKKLYLPLFHINAQKGEILSCLGANYLWTYLAINNSCLKILITESTLTYFNVTWCIPVNTGRHHYSV